MPTGAKQASSRTFHQCCKIEVRRVRYGALPLLAKANRLLRPDQTQRRLTNCDRQTIRVRDRALQISVKRRDATTIETVRKQPQGAS